MLVAFVLAGGVYYFLYALRYGRRLSVETIALYALLGAGGVLVGVAFAALVLAGMI